LENNEKATAATRWGEVRVISKMVGLKNFMESRGVEPAEEATLVKEALADGVVDFDEASRILKVEQREAYSIIFNRYCGATPGSLPRHGMQHALVEVGLAPKTDAERRKLQFALEQIVMHTRQPEGDDMCGIRSYASPLQDKNATWTLSEFLLLVGAMRDLVRREQCAQNHAIAEELSMPIADVDVLRGYFCRFDANGSHTINRQELQNVLESVDLHLTPEELHAMLDAMGLGTIDQLQFRQFVRAVSHIENHAIAEELSVPIADVAVLRGYFYRFDANGSQTISRQELQNFLESVDLHLTPQELHAMLDAVGLGTTDQLQFRQFVRAVKHIEDNM